ncbi:MAG: (d)CMP kinase [Alistipes sp.]|nr:(d)CMP kinase [Alistipes sp.]
MNSSTVNSSASKITIAIDGFSSCGKSTFAREIAARLGYIFVDTGAMYRAVTLFGLRQGAITTQIDTPKLIALLPKVQLTFRFNPARGASDLYLNDENVESQIRSLEVSDWVSRVSQIGAVRTYLVHLQQEMGRHKGIVMDGRDIGTVVFPDAELKIFMTADPQVRAQRRYRELQAKGDPTSLEEVARNLRERDEADQHREISPLRQAQDAVVLDNSHMTVEQQMEWVMQRVAVWM